MIDKAKRTEIRETEEREDCIFCDGRGYSRYSIPSEFKKVSCECCNGEGIINYKCNKCDGTGRYVHPVLKRDVGECQTCKGTGKFYPRMKRFVGRNIRHIPGTKFYGLTCFGCDGTGIVEIPTDEKEYFRSCSRCSGVGEIKMCNPVLSGDFLAK